MERSFEADAEEDERATGFNSTVQRSHSSNSSNNSKFLKGQAKSVIYGSSSHRRNTTSLNGFKMPWVPAPGKSTSSPNHVINPTTSTSRIFMGKGRGDYSSSSSAVSCDECQQEMEEVAMKNGAKGKKKKTQAHPAFKTRSSRNVPREVRRKGTSSKAMRSGKNPKYQLKSKDSLVDVTAFLKDKKEEILRLWKHNLNSGHPELLEKFQLANALAQEAVEEVEKLRQSIQSLHEKDSSLSDGDCKLLDTLREKVLEKIQHFQEINTHVHQALSRQNSATNTDTLKPDPPNLDVSKTAQFFENYDNPKSVQTLFSKANNKTPVNQVTVKGHKSATSIPSSTTADLSTLAKLYNESSEFEEFPRIDNQNTDSLSRILDFQKQLLSHNSSHPDFDNHFKTKQAGSSVQDSLSPTVQPDSKNVFMSNRSRVKVHSRGSQASLIKPKKSSTVHFAKSDFTDEVSSSESVTSEPDFLPAHNISHEDHCATRCSTGSRGETSKCHCSCQYELQLHKDKVMGLQKKLISTEGEMDELKEDLRLLESESDFRVSFLKSSLEDKIQGLETIPNYIQQLDAKISESSVEKKELHEILVMKDMEIRKIRGVNEDLKDQLGRLRTQLEDITIANHKVRELEHENSTLKHKLSLAKDDIESLRKKVQASAEGANTTECQCHSRLNQRLEYKNNELKIKLIKMRKNCKILQNCREKMMEKWNNREIEMLNELQKYRDRSRQLETRISFMKKTYGELFPTDHTLCCPNHCDCVMKKPSTSNLKKNKSSEKVNHEAHISKSKTWVCGSS